MRRSHARVHERLSALGALLAAAPLSPLEVATRAGIVPDAWQADVLRSRSDRLLLNCCRQSGKSTITATIAVHTAVSEPGALVLLVSPTLRQSGELFKKSLGIYRALGRPVPAESETALTLTLENGSRLVSLPGKDTVRGYSGAALIAIDEAARVPDDLYIAIRPMLAVSAGRLIALSTPWGRRGWWYREWAEGGALWQRHEIPASQCPRIPASFLEEEKRSMGPLWFESEYLCRFAETEGQLFAYADIERAVANGRPARYPGGFLARQPA